MGVVKGTNFSSALNKSLALVKIDERRGDKIVKYPYI